VENQRLEWKENWHDDYLKTLCAFANTDGGTLELGRNDTGEVVGITDVKKLLDLLPNKIKNTIAVVGDIAVHVVDGKQYISITIGKYTFPISYHGRYYIRHGSTTQEVTGVALNEFLLRKQGKKWDSIPVPNISLKDFESNAFKVFRKKAIESTRLSKQDLEISDEKLLDTLNLTEGDYLKRAAVLLFHQDYEKYIQGAYIKIGMFANNTDILYQHEVHCPLIMMPDAVMETIYLNYFKGIISYDGIHRKETYPVPQAAFREAITNAICHRDYSTEIPIQIKVFPDKVIIYNDGQLPLNWTVADLLSTHRSQPYNPLIANTFFRAGLIESWGRGIENITKACIEAGKPEPTIEFKYGYEFSITFYTSGGITTNDTNAITTNGDFYTTTTDATIDTYNYSPITTNGKKGITTNGKKDITTNVNKGFTTNGEKSNTTNANKGITTNGKLKRTKTPDLISNNNDSSITTNGENTITTNLTPLEIKRRILRIMHKTPNISIKEIAQRIGITERNIKNHIKTLKNDGKIERIGATKNGIWVVKKNTK